MSVLVELTDDTFDREVLQAGQPALVEFWAPWCGSCKALMPIVEQLAADRGNDIKFCELNVEDNNDMMANFSIRNIPTLMLFKDGLLAASKTGVMSKAELDAFIDQNL